MDFRAYKPSTWWKLAGLAVVTTALIVLLTVPTTTVTVKLDYPPGTTPPSPGAEAQVSAAVTWMSAAIMATMILAVIGLLVWLVRRILRNGRIASRGPQA
jgi:hypothetical protein